ncbi:MAG: histidinol-phosphate aminotransferase [Peptococcaceae bacterium BRH_c4a]|nr:MAG: histidinol-phosphate aminotransferase [Peptococcaceae bacterium BRH_c4a]
MGDSFDPGRLKRQDLNGMEPYDAYYAPGVIRLDANENPHDFPAEVREYMVSRMEPQFFGRYPDSMARELVRDLASFFAVGTENIMVGNGSDELILNIMLAFGVGRKVHIASPTFSMYGIHARVAGAAPVNVQRDQDFEVDVEAMIRSAGEEPSVIIICNPNNPTGTVTSPEDIAALAGSVNSLVVVDEAYIEFGGQSCIPLLDKYPNLMVLRTFSKAFGLAGMRVGYLLASPEVVRELMRIKQPFNVNSFSQMAARAVLKFRSLFQDSIGRIIIDRKNLEQNLRQIPGVKVYPTVANFLFFSTGAPAGEVYRGLLEEGVMIRFIGVPGRGDYLRVSVGTERENNIFIDKLKSVLAAPKF